MRESNPDERVLVMAPVGQDASVVADLLAGHGFAAQVCGDPAECCAQIYSGAGALVLTEEAMELGNASDVLDALKAQPTWSELPLIILTTGGKSRLARLLDLAATAAGSVTLLERPIGTTTLLRSIDVALNSRRRQYQVRDMIEEQQHKRLELEQAEETLRRAKEFHEAVTDNMGEGIYTVDSQGLVTFMNPAAEELFGWTLEELRGCKMHDVTHYKHPDGSPFPAGDCPGLQVLRFGGTLTDQEDLFIRKDGTFFDVVYSSSPIRERGNITGLVVVFRDVTARKQAEEESGRLAAIVNSSSDPILSKTITGIVTSWNAAAEQMFGYTAQEMIGQPILRLIPVARHAEEKEILARLKAGERIEHYETVRVTKDGRYLDVSLTISPIKDSTGRIIGASKIIHDIAKRKQVEKELREAHAQLTDRAQQLEFLVQLRTTNLAMSNGLLRREIVERRQAEAARESLRRQLLNAQEEERRRIARELHDQMGQNLTALNFGLKSLYDADPCSEPLRHMLPPLQALAAQTARDLNRVALELRPSTLDDLGLVKAVRNLVETWSARCQIEADFEAARYDSSGISPETETTLYRVMQEALNNVAKHAGARRVSLVLQRAADHVQAIIEDDGRGFDAASALQASNGRGRLGLVGIQERLALAGGSLHVESAPGCGASLLIRVPIPKSR